jgi:CBS domain-containing protein
MVVKISDCMKEKVVSIAPDATINEAAKIFVKEHIGALPVVDEGGKLIGTLQLHDILSLVLPDFLKFLEDFDFVSDFGAVEERSPLTGILARPVSEIMQQPIAVEAESGLLRAFAILRQHQLHDLPVVDKNGLLVGIASHVDIGTAFLSQWNVTQDGEE